MLPFNFLYPSYDAKSLFRKAFQDFYGYAPDVVGGVEVYAL